MYHYKRPTRDPGQAEHGDQAPQGGPPVPTDKLQGGGKYVHHSPCRYVGPLTRAHLGTLAVPRQVPVARLHDEWHANKAWRGTVERPAN